MINIDFKPYSKKEIIIKRIFFRFLKDSDLYPLYICNMNNIEINDVYWDFKPSISDGRTLIASAFRWNRTKEGFDFWKKRHELWLQYLTLSNIKENNKL